MKTLRWIFFVPPKKKIKEKTIELQTNDCTVINVVKQQLGVDTEQYSGMKRRTFLAWRRRENDPSLAQEVGDSVHMVRLKKTKTKKTRLEDFS